MDHARKHSRYGHRESTMILVAYRHGLRASELCDLQWHQVELDQGRMHVHRAKNGTPSVHPIRGDEIRALRKLQREKPTRFHRRQRRHDRRTDHETKKTVPLKAILALVQYLEVDERKHFERMSYAGEGTSTMSSTTFASFRIGSISSLGFLAPQNESGGD